MKRTALFILAVLLGLATGAFGQLGNAWHLPANVLPGGGTMRQPLGNVTSASTVVVFSGNQFQGAGGNPGNQTGGTLFYKAAAETAWQSAALSFHSESGNDKFWRASIGVGGVPGLSSSGAVQYYFQINYSDRATTFLHGTDSTSQATGAQATAAASPFAFTLSPELTVDGVRADYTTSKLYVNETAADPVPLVVVFHPNAANADPASVQVFTNLNRRDFAAADAPDDGDAFEDGIQPPHGDTVTTTSASYYRAFAMNADGGGRYSLTLHATKTGAYRLTARYRTAGSASWIYYSGDGAPWRGETGGRRDHAITVAPTKTRDIIMYEANPLTIEASGTLEGQRSTFDDLLGAADGDNDGFDPFNPAYLQGLGVNWLWFQPIHPAGIDGRQIDPATAQPFEVGSPYAVRNFFRVNPLLGSDNTEADARLEFQNFVNKADLAGINVMLDAPFNHTAYDCEVAAQGVAYFGGAAGQRLRDVEARFFSRDPDGAGPASGDYCQRASSAATIAVAPDRGDFGKFGDTYDVFYGRYSALVCQNPADNGSFNNEGDRFLYDDPAWTADDTTKNVWRYFGDYLLYWLGETGCAAGLSPAEQADKGIDGLRADFGQGLPPPAWEYIINKTRSRKWSFVFMAEALDGGAVTYRSNRHFDVLKENIVVPLHAATSTAAYRSIFESRRASYGQAVVLLNSSSHDEDHYQDPFEALIRYAVSSTNDGAPMIFPGQELGLSGAVVPPGDTQSGLTPFGYDRYEINFGKPIPHFKKFNSLAALWSKRTSVDPADYGIQQLAPVYASICQARRFSAALRSSNRHFLNLNDGTPHGQIFSVAKFERRNGAPNLSDVVLGFVNVDRNANPATAGANRFNLNADVDMDGMNDFGIKPARRYNVKNIAAYLGTDAGRRDVFLIPGGALGSELLADGLFVALHRVPTSIEAWASAPFEAQYLKLYDVTPPPSAGVPATPKTYAIGNAATFSWTAVTDPEGGVSGYRVIVSTQPNGSGAVLFDGFVTGVSKTASGAFGQKLFATVRAINQAGIESAAASASVGGTLLLDPAADHDGDGAGNASEDAAQTDPLSTASVLKVLEVARQDAASVKITWSSAPAVGYEVLASADLDVPFMKISGPTIPSAGAATSYTDADAGGAERFYRVRVASP